MKTLVKTFTFVLLFALCANAQPKPGDLGVVYLNVFSWLKADSISSEKLRFSGAIKISDSLEVSSGTWIGLGSDKGYVSITDAATDYFLFKNCLTGFGAIVIPAAIIDIKSVNATDVPFAVRAHASQTGNLFEVYDNTNTKVFYIDRYNSFISTGIFYATNNGGLVTKKISHDTSVEIECVVGTKTVTIDAASTVLTDNSSGGNAGDVNSIRGFLNIELQATTQLAGSETEEHMDDTPDGEWSDSEAGGNVTVSADATYYKEGSYSLKLVFGEAAAAEDGVQYTTGQPYDFSSDEYEGVWIYSTVALSANEFAFELADDGGEQVCLYEESISANVWKWIRFTLPAADADKDNISEIRFVLKADKGACTIYLDAATKWDAADAVTLNQDIIQDGFRNCIFQTYADGNTHEGANQTMYSTFLIDWGATTSYFVPIGDQSAYCATLLYFYE